MYPVLLLTRMASAGEAPIPDPTVLPDGLGHLTGTYGPWALLGGVVLAIITGQLVPRRVHADVKDERDYYRAAAREAWSQRDAARDAATQTAVAVTQALPPHPAADDPPPRTPGVRLL